MNTNHIGVCCCDGCRMQVGRALLSMRGAKYYGKEEIRIGSNIVFLFLPGDLPRRAEGVEISSYWICKDILDPVPLGQFLESRKRRLRDPFSGDHFYDALRYARDRFSTVERSYQEMFKRYYEAKFQDIPREWTKTDPKIKFKAEV